jgi:hypothetical protein
MIGRGNRSTRRKPAPVPLYPPQTTHAARTRTHAAAVGSQRLTAWSTARLHSMFGNQLLLGPWWRRFLKIRVVGGGVQLGPLGTSATNRTIVPTPNDYDVGEIGGMMIGKGNRSTWRKPVLVPLLSTINPTWPDWAGSQRLTSWIMARFQWRRLDPSERCQGSRNVSSAARWLGWAASEISAILQIFF